MENIKIKWIWGKWLKILHDDNEWYVNMIAKKTPNVSKWKNETIE